MYAPSKYIGHSGTRTRSPGPNHATNELSWRNICILLPNVTLWYSVWFMFDLHSDLAEPWFVWQILYCEITNVFCRHQALN